MLPLKVAGKTVPVSNLKKVYYPDAGFTKGEVIAYYMQIAPVLLPHLKGRPLTLKRYPNGVDAPFFYEKQCPPHPRIRQDNQSGAPSRTGPRGILPGREFADAGLGGEPRRPGAAHLSRQGAAGPSAPRRSSSISIPARPPRRSSARRSRFG